MWSFFASPPLFLEAAKLHVFVKRTVAAVTAWEPATQTPLRCHALWNVRTVQLSWFTLHRVATLVSSSASILKFVFQLFAVMFFHGAKHCHLGDSVKRKSPWPNSPSPPRIVETQTNDWDFMILLNSRVLHCSAITLKLQSFMISWKFLKVHESSWKFLKVLESSWFSKFHDCSCLKLHFLMKRSKAITSAAF